MAIINSYPPVKTLDSGDLLLICDTSIEGNPTRTTSIGDVIALIPPLVPGGGTMNDWKFTGTPGPSAIRTVANNDQVTFRGGDKLGCTTAPGLLDLTIDHDATTRVDTTSTLSPAAGASFTCIDSVTQDATGHPTAVNVKTVTLPQALPYIVYSALLTQATTAAPTTQVLQNTIPGTLTWTRSGPGEYTLTSNLTPFTLNKTQLFINNGLTAGTASMIKWTRTSTSVIDIKTINLAGVKADDLLAAGSIEIRVYS